MSGKFSCCRGVKRPCCASLCSQRIKQRCALFGCYNTALCAQKYITRRFFGRNPRYKPQNIFCGKGEGERTTSLRFCTMRFVYNPIPNGRKQSPVGREVTKEQAMICYHNICCLRTAPCAVNKAVYAEVRTLSSQTVMTCCSNQIAGQRSVINFKTVHVIIFGLLYKGKKRGESRGLRLLLPRNHAHSGTLCCKSINLAQTRVMGKPLEGRIRKRLRLFCACIFLHHHAAKCG